MTSNETTNSDFEQNPAPSHDGQSIAELFARDPLELTASDRRAIVKKMREDRSRWLSEQAAKKSKGTKTQQRQNIAAQLDLDNLDIEL